MTVGNGCRLYLGLTGSTLLAMNEGKYKWNSLTIGDGGELRSTSDVGRNALTLEVGDVTIQGGGTLHMKRISVVAENFTVDDLGELRGDVLDAK